MSIEKDSFLFKKYPDLTGSKPVERAVREGIREGEKGPQTKEDRVEAYLNRIEKIISSGTKINDERGWELLKNKIIKEFSIDADDSDTLAKIAHGLYESEKKLAVEQGRGTDVERLEREIEHQGGIIERYKGLVKEKREIQEKTLSGWLDYLKINDAQYPMWFRYFVVRNLQRMGTIEKEKGEYTKRTPYTVAPFPELNSEALGFVYRMLTEGFGKEEYAGEEDKEKRQKLENLIAKKDFIKLYAFAQIETAGKLNKETVEGQWIKYNQKSDHRILENALRGKGTGWCTAEGSAYSHLQGGDFYVYYSKGPNGQYTEPRVAIRMQGNQVGEVRGVNPRQELEPALIEIARKQYHDLPGGESYEKTASDMKQMTAIYNKCFKVDKETGEKTYLNPFLTKEELIFLYEIESKIQYFGYDPDPRIAEVRSQRKPKEDAPIVFECDPQEIAWGAEQVDQNTKAYVGPLFPGIFTVLGHLEHLYTAFPEGKITRGEVEIGGKNAAELEQELKNKNINTDPYALDMLHSRDFTTLQNKEQIQTIRLKVRDLGFPSGATIDQIYAKAQELGLKLCPAEVGPYERLQNEDQPMGEWYAIAMKQIADRFGRPIVFTVFHLDSGLWLDDRWTSPDNPWSSLIELMFRLRNVSQKT